MENCEHCKKEKEITEIQNYTIVYEESVSFNCCTEQCAKDKALQECEIREEDIISILE